MVSCIFPMSSLQSLHNRNVLHGLAERIVAKKVKRKSSWSKYPKKQNKTLQVHAEIWSRHFYEGSEDFDLTSHDPYATCAPPCETCPGRRVGRKARTRTRGELRARAPHGVPGRARPAKRRFSSHGPLPGAQADIFTEISFQTEVIFFFLTQAQNENTEL